jgi:membrane fusion protein (multidrug efflux system)
MPRSLFPSVSSRAAAALALAALAGLLPGCGKRGPGGFSFPPMPVETVEVSRGPVLDRFEVVGTIEAGDAITVVAEISAQVTSLPFQEGGGIAKGGLIAQLDDAQLRADVDRATAERDQRRTTYDRVKSIVDQSAGAPQDLDDASAALRVAEANLALAQARLAKTRITAPFDGILGARRVSPGAFVRAGDPITNLARVRELRIVFSVPERYLGQLRRGAAVRAASTAFPGDSLAGRIDAIDPVIDPATRSATVVARAWNPGGKFRPGMSADISAVLSQRQDALTIPGEAVFVEGDQPFVYVVNTDSTFQRAPVTLGTRLADAVEVVSGLTAGQRVVRAGQQKLAQLERMPGKPKVLPIQSAPGAGPQ